MEKKVYSLGNEAREKIKATAKFIGDTIGKTLGPAGRNYFLPNGITNDGKEIMKQIRFKGECQDQIALAFHEIARQQDKDAGDGTTTAMVIGAKIIEEIIDKIGDIDVPMPNSVSSMEILKRLEDEKDKAISLLENKIEKVEDLEALKKVAFTAMEHKEGADIIAEAIWEGGKNTFPVINEGFNEKIEKEVIKGVSFPLKIAHQSFFNKVNEAEVENALVLVLNHHFEEYAELSNFFSTLLNEQNRKNRKNFSSLIIIAKNFSIPFINSVSVVSKGSGAPIIPVSADFHEDTFKDIAAFVDAKYIDTHPKTGKKITDISFDDAGFIKKAIIREKESIFIGGRGLERVGMKGDKMINCVEARIEEIKEALKNEKNNNERDLMEKRIAILSGGITTIYIDAKTLAERHYLKLKAEDTINSCRAALNYGIVKGGGVALKEVAEELNEDSFLYKSLLETYNRIKKNNVGNEVDNSDIYDAYLVNKSAIENAVSVVKILISVEGIIADKEKDLFENFSEKILKE